MITRIICEEGMLALIACICWEDKQDPNKMLTVDESFLRIKGNFKRRDFAKLRKDKIPKEKTDKIFMLYKEGRSKNSISVELNIHISTVNRYLRGEVIL